MMLMSEIGPVNRYYSNSSVNTCSRKNISMAPTYDEKVGEAATLGAGADDSKVPQSSNDVVMSIPPRIDSTYNMDTNKSTEEMTKDEYKQFICNKIANLPMSVCFRTQHTGELIIKDAAFEHMKSDPKYEETVLNMLRKGFAVQHMYAPCYGVQVIGGTMADTYGYAVPINNASSDRTKTSNEKTWWEKRCERMEALLDEQSKKAEAKCATQRKLQIQELFASQQQQRSTYRQFLEDEGQKVEPIMNSARQTVARETVAKVIDAYDKNGFSDN